MSDEVYASLNDVDSIYGAIKKCTADGTFVVFMPEKPRKGEFDVLNIQYSIERGKLGLDWVLVELH